ncbi:glycosyltransferase family 2 protein [Ferroplasma sp.]|uniref:glycosyltransferase n=1 Tax=Ferroplasma sp. TaxID=2591003 RepID=UPI00307E717D
MLFISAGFIYIEMHKYKSEHIVNDYRPKTLVIMPVKGIDYSLETNLLSIKKQKYDNFKLLCVVDSEKEEALEIIRKLEIDYIISSYNCNKCSGKVRAISTAIEKFKDYNAYLLADSDIEVNENWLLDMVMPLKNQDAGLSTTFPYFEPKNGFWSNVKEIWGFVGMGLMESKLTRFGWGGSLGFRSEFIQDSLGFFSEHISDDTALTKICKQKGKKIYYVDSAMPDVNSPDNFKIFFEWANRQTALSISASPKVYYYGMLFYGSYMFLFLSAIFMGIFYNPLYFLFLIPSAIYIYNMLKRLKHVKPDNILAAIMLPVIYMINLIIARRMKSISWRGSTYDIQDKNLL